MAIQWEKHRMGTLMLALAALAGFACQGESISGSAVPAQIRVTMQRLGGATATQAVAGWFASAVGGEASIDLSTVDSR